MNPVENVVNDSRNKRKFDEEVPVTLTTPNKKVETLREMTVSSNNGSSVEAAPTTCGTQETSAVVDVGHQAGFSNSADGSTTEPVSNGVSGVVDCCSASAQIREESLFTSSAGSSKTIILSDHMFNNGKMLLDPWRWRRDDMLMARASRASKKADGGN